MRVAVFPLRDLPFELLVEVASHLTLYEVFKYRSVSRMFSRLTSNNGGFTVFSLHTALSLQPHAFCDPLTLSPFSTAHPSQDAYITSYEAPHMERVRRLLADHTFPAVHTLYLGRLALCADLLHALTERCGRIESVHGMLNNTDTELRSLEALVDAFPHLRAVHLDCINNTAHAGRLGPLLRLTEMRDLHLEFVGRPYAVLDAEPPWHSLHSLKLFNAPVNGRRWWLQQRLPQLTELSLVKVCEAAQLESILCAFPRLSHLTLSLTACDPPPGYPLFPDYALQRANAGRQWKRCPAEGRRRGDTAAAAAALSDPPPYRVYASLVFLNISACPALNSERLLSIGAVCPSLCTVNVSENGQLGKAALLALLTPTAFPSLVFLYADRLRSSAFSALLASRLPSNPRLRLLHLANGDLCMAGEGRVTARTVAALSTHFPSLSSLDLSHRERVAPSVIRFLLAQLPKLRTLRLQRMAVGSLEEVEQLCERHSGTLRDVHVSITGVLPAREARGVMGGRMLKSGKEGDVARRAFASQVRERVWLRSWNRVTLHLDVDDVHPTFR